VYPDPPGLDGPELALDFLLLERIPQAAQESPQDGRRNWYWQAKYGYAGSFMRREPRDIGDIQIERYQTALLANTDRKEIGIARAAEAFLYNGVCFVDGFE
jgi:hypothetical protein